MSLTDLDRFKAACVYPGKLDEQAVEHELVAFLQALGEKPADCKAAGRVGAREAANSPFHRFLKCLRVSRLAGLVRSKVVG